MTGTSNDRPRDGMATWIVRSLVVTVVATLIVAVRRSRSRRRAHLEHLSWSTMSPAPASTTSTTSNTSTATRQRPRHEVVTADQTSDGTHLDPESPERDVLDQRRAAAPEPVDDLPRQIPPEQPEADVLEQSREVSVEDDEPQVVDEPPRDG